jgi:NAD-dependent dihydropyrimidine dehydrogenase PreA subunit
MSLKIDGNKCTGCGACRDVCPKQAITMRDDLAVINEKVCIQCGVCVEVCPVGAIREVVSAYEKLWKGGKAIPYGYRRGFGFRRFSPSRPYVGRGRGRLPRHWYPGLAMALPHPPTPPIYSPRMTQEAEIDWLKRQFEAMKSKLNQVEARIRDLESAK